MSDITVMIPLIGGPHDGYELSLPSHLIEDVLAVPNTTGGQYAIYVLDDSGDQYNFMRLQSPT